MSRRAGPLLQAVVLGALAAGIGRLATSGNHLAYVRPGMRGPLLLSASVLFVLALTMAWFAGERAEPADRPAVDPAHGHDHGAFPKVGIWLLVPIACIAVVPILPLGSSAVTERRVNVIPSGGATATPPPLGSGELTLLDYVTRVSTQPDHPFLEPVTLTGFVASTSPDDDSFVLGRFVMSCCAADAQPVLITVRSPEKLPPKDAWVQVTGTQVGAPTDLPEAKRADPANLVVAATEVERVRQPDEPYLTA